MFFGTICITDLNDVNLQTVIVKIILVNVNKIYANNDCLCFKLDVILESLTIFIVKIDKCIFVSEYALLEPKVLNNIFIFAER